MLALLLCTTSVLPTVRAQAWLGASAVVERSRWQEFDAQGTSLVRELGNLHGGSLLLGSRWVGVDWQAEWVQVGASRTYQGVSSTGAPISTASDLRQQTASLTGWLPLSERWSAGARLGARRLDREIASVGAVQGYPENFEDWQGAVGARLALLLGSASTLTAETWLGAGPGGRLTLRLPRADPTTLSLGSSRLVELGLTWQGDLTETTELQGWQWWLRLRYRQERFAAGPATAVSRNGVIVGGAAQPETHQAATGLQVGLLYRFMGL